MWRFLQGIPRGFRGNLNGSVRQSAPQSVCRDEEKDGDFLHKFASSDHKVLSKGNTRCSTEITIHHHREWHEWKKTHFHHHYWKHQCQHCRLIEAVGWSSALLLGCKLSQLWKYKQAHEERKQLAEYLLPKKVYEVVVKEPSLLVSYISESKNTSGKEDIESDVKWPKSPPIAEEVEEHTEKEKPTNSGRKQTPVAWAVSQFPSLWDKPLIAESKLLAQFSEKLQADSKTEVETSSDHQDADFCSCVEDLDKLCESIKYNREGNRFARSGNFAKAILCWQRAGRSGSAKANFNLGLCYEIGSGVAVDKQKAVEYYSKAARGGSAVAAHNLALIYLTENSGGQLEERQVKKAKEFLRQASQQGLAEAQVDLGVMFTESGDMEMAAHLFSEAAQQKDSTAEYYLGLCYENGWGVPRNLCKSADLYSKASKQGHSSAQFNLASFFENGLGGLPVDKPAAHNLYKNSCSGGHTSAAKHVSRLDRELKESELTEEQNIGEHLKISASVPALTSYLKNHISQLGKLEWDLTAVEGDCLHKASTIGDFRQTEDQEDFITQNLIHWGDTGDSCNKEESCDSSSVVLFDLGEGDPHTGDYLSLSGQFGDMPSLPKHRKSPGLHRSPSFDRLSILSDSDASEISIVFDDNFEGFRLIHNKTEQKEEESIPPENSTLSGLRRMSGNSYREFDMFDSNWALSGGSSDLSLGRQVLACN